MLNQHSDTVRARMRNGDLPQALKDNGIWEISIPDMAGIRTATFRAPQIPLPPVIVGGARRRRAVAMNYRTDRFGALVLLAHWATLRLPTPWITALATCTTSSCDCNDSNGRSGTECSWRRSRGTPPGRGWHGPPE